MALYNLIEKKRKEKRKKIVKAAVLSTVVGGGIGALSGILLAPKSGKDTRDDIKEKVNNNPTARQRLFSRFPKKNRLRSRKTL